MKKAPDVSKSQKGLRKHYDFSQGERGKYARMFGQKSNLVLLRPEVAEFFSSSEEVNNALLQVIKSRKVPRR